KYLLTIVIALNLLDDVATAIKQSELIVWILLDIVNLQKIIDTVTIGRYTCMYFYKRTIYRRNHTDSRRNRHRSFIITVSTLSGRYRDRSSFQKYKIST